MPIIGKINVPVKLQSSSKGDWRVDKAPETVNLKIALDQRSASFTPSLNGFYRIIGPEVFEVQVGGIIPPTPTPQPQPEPQPVPSGTKIYDSNTDIDWPNWDNKKIEIGKPYGDPTKPNTGYWRMNASGSPTITFLAATKEIILQHNGKYGRGYLGKCAYGCRVESEFKLDSCDNNYSQKSRNQHQYNEYLRSVGLPEVSNPIGGQGGSLHCNESDADFEITHDGGEASGPSATISPKLEAGKYYGCRFSQFDKDGKIHVIIEIDRKDGQGFKVVNEGDVTVPSKCFDRASFEKWSEIWFRLNAPKGGKLYLKNIKVYTL